MITYLKFGGVYDDMKALAPMDRSSKVPLDCKKEDVLFQVVHWSASDLEQGEDFENKYLIKAYGVTAEGTSVALNITDFTPFFMIKIHHRIAGSTSSFVVRMEEHVRMKLPQRLVDGFLNAKLLKKKEFWGFTNNADFYYMRFTFKNVETFRACERLFARDVQIPGVHARPERYRLYESNIEPFLRFMHIKDIQPAGWIRVAAGRYYPNEDLLATNCQIDLTCDWKNVEAVSLDRIAPLTILSFDLECTSSHGDFPVARKDYKKVAFELMQTYYETTFDSEEVLHEIRTAFQPDAHGKLSKVFPKDKLLWNKAHFDKYVLPKLHRSIEDICNILRGKLILKNEKWTSVSKASKDDVIGSLTKKLGMYVRTGTEDHPMETWVGIFPPLEGDPIIQIGTTVHTYGETDCSFRHIITLGSCDPIEGVEIETCDNEEEMMMAWQRLVHRLDPDVITGYNIFGFDMVYLYDRARELHVEEAFMKLGRLTGMKCKFQEKKLSSSALGDNILRYIDMDGRVLIDIMKVVQRDHKLDSFKLDHVANHFMNMNKHDVSPNDIFRLFKGSSADRKVVAEYCVQDCALCNKLMMKLEILANNIGMANVCNVPLSYIFMRGQGVKIFSLVAKFCRENNMMIPTIKKKYKQADEEEPEDEDGYEGAIVLPPKQGIYLDRPVNVWDYASLYPSSMISENLSHDMLVLDEKYDNLPGVEYLTVSYDVYEGTGDKKVKVGQKDCKFVQLPNNEKGIIPRILMKLLKARKDTRKKIEYQTVTAQSGAVYKGLVKNDHGKVVISTVEGDKHMIPEGDVISMEDTYNDFEKAVLDGLQLAYKVTANSLYGQIGAKTSQIYLKDIAACTTATGRKMILKAKEFLETHYLAEIVYGDSVSGDTPLLVQDPSGKVDVKTIETMSKTWLPFEKFRPWDEEASCKEQAIVDARVWTNGKWSKVIRVIRHKTNKRMYRVNTFQGCVDVTEDHSIIDINGQEIKPKDCVVKETDICHSYPNEFDAMDVPLPRYVKEGNTQVEDETMYECRECQQTLDGAMFYYKKSGYRDPTCKLCIKERNCKREGRDFSGAMVPKVLTYDVPSRAITKEEAWVFGLFFGDGSCGNYVHISKASWAINNSNLQFLERAKSYLEACEPSFMKFKVLDTMASSAVYKLVPVGSLHYMVEKYRELFYDKDAYKKVPAIILNGSYEVRKWFMDGYLTADGSKRDMKQGCAYFACKGKIGSMGLFYILKSIGHKHIRVLIHPSKPNTYWIRTTKDQRYVEKFGNKVMDVVDLGVPEEGAYVYDIETEEGVFNAGVGSIVCKNTDSIFAILPSDLRGKDALLPSIQTAIKASDEFKPQLKAPHDLEYEKTFWPFILFSKKRYVGNLYEHDDKKYKQKSMGIALKRRDNANIVKKVYGGCIDIILNQQDVQRSVEFLKNQLQDMVDGKCPLEELIITKSLRADYKDPERIAHKVLADRMGERDPGNKPQSNDRIPYVYIQVPDAKKGAKILQGNRIEHPEFIRQNKLKPDYAFYITNQVMKPVCQLYALTLEKLEGYRKPKDFFTSLERKLIQDKEGDMKKVKDKLADVREDVAKEILFDPFLHKLENKKQGNRVITDFFKMG